MTDEAPPRCIYLSYFRPHNLQISSCFQAHLPVHAQGPLPVLTEAQDPGAGESADELRPTCMDLFTKCFIEHGDTQTHKVVPVRVMHRAAILGLR